MLKKKFDEKLSTALEIIVPFLMFFAVLGKSCIFAINYDICYMVKVVGKIDLGAINQKTRPSKELKKKKLKRREAVLASVEPEENVREEAHDENEAIGKREVSKNKVIKAKKIEYIDKKKSNRKAAIPTKDVLSVRKIIRFSQLIFKEGRILLKDGNRIFAYQDQRIVGYDKVVINYLSTVSKQQKDYLNSELVQVQIYPRLREFEFVDFDIYGYIGNLRNSSDIVTKRTLNKTTNCGIDNIEFYDGYYIVSLWVNGKKSQDIQPLKVNDADSYAILRHVHRYFADRFPKDIKIEYDDKRIIGIKPPYVIGYYIRTLQKNIDVHGEWWEEIQNERKPSLKQCRSISQGDARKRVSLKNGYLDNLAAIQSEQKLIPVYEINHGVEQNAFIFTISMPNKKCAIIFENVSSDSSTATEVFVTKIEDYEVCLNLVFDYFTDYTITTKRDSLRRGVNPPDRFKAENFYSVPHGEINSWLVRLYKILNIHPQTSNIEFVPGLHIPGDYDVRLGHGEIETRSIHNVLMRRLYAILCKEYGEDNVGTEIKIGTKRIDAVVKKSNSYDIYEVKSDSDPLACITIGLGQICQYAFLYCRNKLGKMVIVGSSPSNIDVDNYLSWFRKQYSMDVYYMSV